MDFRKDICIYCHSSLSTKEGDHVPPEGFFPNNRGFPIIQVPCCQSCNVRFSKDDQAARNLLASLDRSERTASVAGEVEATMLRDISRSEGLSYQFINRHIILEQLQPASSPSDLIEQEWRLRDEREVRGFFMRVMRAVAFWELGVLTVKPHHGIAYLGSLLPEQADAMMECMREIESKVFSDVFEYRCLRVPDEGVRIWMKFYQHFEVIGLIKASDIGITFDRRIATMIGEKP